MRYFNLKLTGILVACLYTQVSINAQDWENQSAAELQQIREMRLLEWHAQQQGHSTQEQSGQYEDQYSEVQVDEGYNDRSQGESQNVSFNQPYQQPPAPAQVAPEREDLFSAANAGNIQQISKLISQGLDVNVANGERETALHMASARGHFEAVMVLVRNGANVNARTVKNWIPLHHAVRFRQANIVNFLVQRGASANARTSDGLSSIDMANNNRDYRILSILGAR